MAVAPRSTSNSGMDTAQMRKLMTNIEKPGSDGNEYNNAAENLKSLQVWIHNTKEAGETEAGMQALIDASGLEIILASMKRNLGDTILANRALEILAGERYSNGAMPFLDDKASCLKLIDLGFVPLILDVLRLPDLQAISRGLACRAIRCLLLIKPEVVNTVVQGGGVEVLLSQVVFVDRPFVFACLSELSRRSSEARDKIRNFPKALPLLLSTFEQRPNDYCPEDDPAAAMLFLHTWSYDEIKPEYAAAGMQKGSEAREILKTAHLKRYSWKNMASDTVSPLVDYASEIGNTYFFIKTAKYQFLAVSLLGIVYNTWMSTIAMKDDVSIWKRLLNILSFGYYHSIAEGQVCFKSGLRTDALIGLKMFKNVNSMIRFFVGTGSLFAAGYGRGFPELEGLQLITRCLGVASSMFFLPFNNCSIVRARLLPGKREFGHSYLHWSHKSSTGFGIALILYQGSEVWSQVTLILFHMIAQPIGLYVNWALHISLLALTVLILTKCQVNRFTFVPMPMAILWTINGGATTALQHMSRAGSVLRLLSLGACWTWIYLKLPDHENLVEHLERKTCLVLFGVAVAGSILHVLCFFHQLLKGRWRFENMDRAAEKLIDNNYRELESTEAMVEKEAGGVYDTAGAAPLLVAQRWKKVHEFLPTAAARVPLDAFVKVHKTLAEGAFPARNVDENSPYMKFVNALFVAATGLMLPKNKADLGKHCFGYSTLLQDEYYEDGTAPDKLGLLKAPAIGWFDPLKVVRLQLQDDWVSVQKDGKFVNLANFKKTILKRHELKLGGITEAIESYNKFLERLFEAVSCISGRSVSGLDQHGFTYAGLFAYEFYFADSRDAQRAEGCGSSTPVADNLGITKPLPSKATKAAS